jgi:hypothetical protein
MKNLRYLFCLTFAVFTVFTVNAFGQAKSDSIKSEKISINKKGEIHDHGWTKLGYIDKNNIARNNQGKKIYFIDQNGNVIDASGKNLGKAQKNGNYYNINGENVITVKDKDQEMCEILDPAGHSLGTVHKNYKLHACAAHCLAIMEKKEKGKN